MSAGKEINILPCMDKGVLPPPLMLDFLENENTIEFVSKLKRNYLCLQPVNHIKHRIKYERIWG